MTDRITKTDMGFSLLETLVALFVIATLAVSGTTLLMQTLQSGKQVDERMTALRDLQVAHALMKEDFASLTPRVTAGVEAFDTPFVFGSDENSTTELMTFTRGGWQVLPGEDHRSDLQRVSYKLQDGALIRTAWLRPDPTRETPIVTRTMLSGLETVEVRYFVGNIWTDDWQTDRMPEAAPRAVEFTFEWPDNDPLTQVFLTGAL